MNFLIKTLLTGLLIFTGFLSHAYSINFDELPKEKDDEKQKSRIFMEQILPDFKDKRSLLKKSAEEIEPDMPYVTDFPIDENEYIVGPGDLFEIHIEDDKHSYEVNPEGNVIVENIAVIPVADSSLKKAKQIILKKIQAVNIKSNCYVNLKRSKTMLVFITGAIGVPGVHRTRGNIRVSDLIIQAKWFRPDAQKGIVIITSKDSTVKKINLGHFLRNGNLDHNPYAKQGDVIHVPFIDYSMPYVTVRRNNTTTEVQLREGDTIEELLTKFEAYQAYPPPHSVVVKEPSKPEKIIGRSGFKEYMPEDHAFIDVSENIEDVYVGGAVQQPGFFSYNKGNTALNYLGQSGLKSESRVSKKIKVVRKGGKSEKILLTSKEIYPGDALIVKQNFEQKLLLYSPLILSAVSLGIGIAALLTR